MNSWGYKKYFCSIKQDMHLAMDELGLSPMQSFGFAHNELAYRLEVFPSEVPLALVALSVCLLDFHHLNELEPDIGFIPELMENIVDSRIDAAIRDLDKSDMKEFYAALAKVKLEISFETSLLPKPPIPSTEPSLTTRNSKFRQR